MCTGDRGDGVQVMSKKRRKARVFWICLYCGSFRDETRAYDCDCPRCPGHTVETCDWCGGNNVHVREVLPRKRKMKHGK